MGLSFFPNVQKISQQNGNVEVTLRSDTLGHSKHCISSRIKFITDIACTISFCPFSKVQRLLARPFLPCYHEALNTEKDRARASADVRSSQKTVALRLPHEEKIPQGNALRSIFLRPRASCLVMLFSFVTVLAVLTVLFVLKRDVLNLPFSEDK